MTKREVKEDGLKQGQNEEIVYSITTTPWGSDPSSVVVTAYDRTEEYEDVSATVLSGDPSVSGDVITTPTVKSLTRGHVYHIAVRFTVGSDVMECFFTLQAER